MKKFIFAAVLLLCFSFSNLAQDAESIKEPQLKHHSVYLELGGNSFIYSINYDYTLQLSDLTKLAIGTGFEYVDEIKINEVSYGSSFCITPAANFLFGRSSHHFETGIAAYYPLSAGTIIPTIRLGYRYQPRNGGFLFRIGATPIVVPGVILPWAGLSVGYTF